VTLYWDGFTDRDIEILEESDFEVVRESNYLVLERTVSGNCDAVANAGMILRDVEDALVVLDISVFEVSIVARKAAV
jgi:hypothetical protein